MAAHYFATGKNPERMGSAHPTIVPYQCFQTSDGKFITVAMGNDKLFRDFCMTIGLEKLPDDPRFATNPDRVKNRNELIPVLEKLFTQRSRDEWLKILTESRLPAGPVYSMSEIFSDPQVLHRKMLVKINHSKIGEINQVGIPMKFSGTEPQIKTPPPILGEHTAEVLNNLLGYSERRIAELEAKGIV